MLRNNSIVHSFYISQKRENNVLWEVIVTTAQRLTLTKYVHWRRGSFSYLKDLWLRIISSNLLSLYFSRIWHFTNKPKLAYGKNIDVRMNCWPVNVCTNGASWASKLPLENWQISWVELATLIWEVGTSYQSILQMTLKFNFYVIV